MRKGRDGGKKRGKKPGKKKKKREKTGENSGHYVIASSRPLERRTLAPKKKCVQFCQTPCIYKDKYKPETISANKSMWFNPKAT